MKLLTQSSRVSKESRKISEKFASGIIIFFLVAFNFLPVTIDASLQAANKKEKTFRVDFRDKDIDEFIKSMSAIIGKNIILDDKVKGKITVISPRRIPVSRAYAYLTSVLAIRGMGIVEENDKLLKIVPIAEAVARSQKIVLGREAVGEDQLQENEIITHIVPIIGGKPSRLSGILKRLTNATTNLVDYDEASMLVITGGSYEVNRLVKIIAEIDVEFDKDDTTEPETQNDSFGYIHIYRLEYMQADKIEAMLRKMNLPDVDQKQQQNKNANVKTPTKKIEVVAHQESNTIIFIGDEEEFQGVKQLIKRIDIPRDQVLLEVLIVEVSADDNNSFGVDWRVETPHTQFNTGLTAEGGIVDTNGDITGVNTLLGFSLGVLEAGADSVAGLINLNVNKENFAILSAPQILTLDNQEAEINVGQDVPVVTGQRTSTEGTISSVSVEYRPTGVKLKFTPHVNKLGMVQVDLFGEVKEIAGTSDVYSNPEFTKRDFKTSVRVNHAQTIVIGGLVSNNRNKSVRKIPIFGDIPVLGFLFKRTSTTIQKKNLLVFITPHVLTNADLATSVTEQLKKQQIKEYKKNKQDVD